MTLRCKLQVPPEAVHVNVTVLMLCGNGSDEPFISDIWSGGGGVMNLDWDLPLPRLACWLLLLMGGRLWVTGILYITILIAMPCSLKYFAWRYLADIF